MGAGTAAAAADAARKNHGKSPEVGPEEVVQPVEVEIVREAPAKKVKTTTETINDAFEAMAKEIQA